VKSIYDVNMLQNETYLRKKKVGDVSAILSTEDHGELMQSIANKTSSQFFHILPVPNNSSKKSSRNGHSQNGEIDADRIFLKNVERSSKNITFSAFKNG
jgi:malonyl-CoA/methylmalonyl-CoA synthetase